NWCNNDKGLVPVAHMIAINIPATTSPVFENRNLINNPAARGEKLPPPMSQIDLSDLQRCCFFVYLAISWYDIYSLKELGPIQRKLGFLGLCITINEYT